MQYGGESDFKAAAGGGAVSGDAAFALKKANVWYLGFFLFFSIMMFILDNTGKSWLGKIIKTKFTGDDIGTQLTARTSFAMAVWFILHGIGTLCNPNLTTSCQFMFHISWIWLHVIVFIAMWVGCWFIPDPLFSVYLQVAMYLSFLYMIIQLLFLVDFFHALNDKFTQGESFCWPMTITVVLSIGALTVLGVDYYLFCKGGCGGNIAIVTVNLILIIILFLASMSVERGSILMSSLIAVYVTYLTTMGLFCESSPCNRMATSTKSVGLSIVASLFTLCWACYSAYSTTCEYKVLALGFDCCECECCDCLGEQEEDAKSFSLSFFHFLFAGASIYMSMVVTCWGASSSVDMPPWSVDRGSVAKWVNIAASWFVILVYGWSLAAPYILTDREFE